MSSPLRPQKVAFLSHTPPGGPFVVGSHHLSRHLAALGCRVAHVSTPYSSLQKRFRGPDPWLVQLTGRGVWGEMGVKCVQPYTLIPQKLASHVSLVHRALDACGLHDPDVVLVDEPLMARAAVRLGGKLIYRPTDVHEGIAAKWERWLVRRCTGVVATSATVLAEMSPPSSTPAMVLSNGVGPEFLSSPPVGDDDSRRGFVYVGALDFRFDWGAVVTLARKFPSERFDLFGPPGSPPLGLPPNVNLAGPVAYLELPERLREYRFGLLPFEPSLVNDGRSPMKLYEYLASGLRVVGRRTSTLGGLAAEWPMHLYDDPSAVQGSDLYALPAPDHGLLLDSQSWATKARQLLDFIAELAK